METRRWAFLTAKEADDIRTAMLGLMAGPWLDYRSAFLGRLAYPPEEVRPFVDDWPQTHLPPGFVRLALGECCGGIRASGELWEEHFGQLSRPRTRELANLVARHVDKMGRWIDEPDG